MRHQNSVFHGLLKQIHWSSFDQLVSTHQADKHVRGLKTKSQLIAMLYAQLSGATSLREVATGLASHSAQLYHLGGSKVARSTFSDANAKRPWQVFAGLFGDLVGQAHRGLRRKLDGAVRLIDATSLSLSNLSADWARFSAKSCGAKAHLIYDPDADCPVYLAITPGRVNDITAAKAMPIEPGATYVFDLGYYDYGWWARLDAAGCRIVTRLKRNTQLRLAEERPLGNHHDILSDRIGRLPERMARSRKNPFQAQVREIRVRIETGKVLRIVTNDLTASAREIADLYKRRWAIELFFRWIKQTLRIRRFMGTSENAIRIQVTVALIAFLLLRMAQAANAIVESPLAFARLVRTNLMHKRSIDALLKPPPSPIFDPRQAALDFTQI
jgi:IS4 transposase